MTTTVKSWNAQRGFGFLFDPFCGPRDLFVHHTQLCGEKNLNAGDTVSYELIDTPKGPAAENVRVISSNQKPQI